MRRALVVVVQGLGIGPAQDAECFGDQNADSLAALAQSAEAPLELANLAQLGLFEAYKLANGRYPAGIQRSDEELVGAYAACEALSSSNERPALHWELAGVPALFDWDYFHPQQPVLPDDLLRSLKRDCKIAGVLGNCQADGLELIQELGQEHIETGQPILYTSGDSLLQIAAHEQHFGLDRLMQLCRRFRQLLDSPGHDYTIGRVIARPFIGDEASGFVRTANRRDFVLPPPAPTVLDKLSDAGGQVIAIGKIADIYARQGISQRIQARSQDALVDQCLAQLQQAPANSLILVGLLHFDELGCPAVTEPDARRSCYRKALEAFDARLPELIDALQSDDLLLLVADGGANFSRSQGRHSREQLPLLITGPGVAPVNLGRRSSLADIGQTLAAGFALEATSYGQSLIAELYAGRNR